VEKSECVSGEIFEIAGKAAAAIKPREDAFDNPTSQQRLKPSAIHGGATRTEAAKIGGVTLQIVRDWVAKFNAHGPGGLIDKKAPGQPSKLADAHRIALVKVVDEGPIPAIHGVMRWRLIDLYRWIFVEFRITLSQQTLSRELRAMGYRSLSARPRHHADTKQCSALHRSPATSPGVTTCGVPKGKVSCHHP
jgi:transposase